MTLTSHCATYPPSGWKYDFGVFHLDVLRRELLRSGQPVKLFPKEFDILLALVERSGELVTRDELVTTVWPDAVVEEGNLTTHVSRLRKLLGDDDNRREYIVTVPGRGYQFVAPIQHQPAEHVKPSSQGEHRKARFIAAGAAFLVAAVAIAAWVRSNQNDPSLNYQQLTFRRGTIWSARFAPDGRTVVYGAAWDGQATAVFLTRPESPESQALGLADADILSVSSSGELAVSLGRDVLRFWESVGTLAHVPLTGGAPREILKGVKDADWAPDGKALAIVRRVEGNDRLEFPIGKVLYESEGYMALPRVSRNGDRVAFLERAQGQESVGVVNAAGEKQTIASGQNAESGLAWSQSGEEVFYTVVTGGSTALHAATGSGNQRLVTRMPGEWKLHDISRDGRDPDAGSPAVAGDGAWTTRCRRARPVVARPIGRRESVARWQHAPAERDRRGGRNEQRRLRPQDGWVTSGPARRWPGRRAVARWQVGDRNSRFCTGTPGTASDWRRTAHVAEQRCHHRLLCSAMAPR